MRLSSAPPEPAPALARPLNPHGHAANETQPAADQARTKRLVGVAVAGALDHHPHRGEGHRSHEPLTHGAPPAGDTFAHGEVEDGTSSDEKRRGARRDL